MTNANDHDRRPWLILSARECIALRSAAYHLNENRWTADLSRAVRMIDHQLDYIADGTDLHAPTAQGAADRDRERKH